MFQQAPIAAFRKLSSVSTSFRGLTRSTSSLYPGDAGKLAYKKRLEQIDTEHLNDETTQSRSFKPIKKSLDTILAHAGLSMVQANSQNEPLCPPIHFETTYTRPSSGDYNSVQEGGKGWIYARMGNPTRKLLQDVLTNLELASLDALHTSKGHDEDISNSNDAITCAFSSGMAAFSSIILALSHQPLHIVLPDDIYHGVPTQLKTIFVDKGITYSSVDMTKLDNIKEKVHGLIYGSKSSNNRNGNILIWMESPSNPLCKVTDIHGVCEWVKSIRSEEHVDIVTAVDSTWAPPCITQPLLLGADAVLHSGTKYLAGHSDVLIGSVTTSPYTREGKNLGHKIKSIQTSLGATASPMDCWLTLRGLRTLHIRLERQCKSAMELAEFLSNHPHVKSVHYPGLNEHPQHLTASKQMKGGLFGGMLSFEVSNECMAMAVAGGVTIIKRATSLGGTETLIEHRASIEPEERRVSPPGLLRISVGLENVEELKHDLNNAIDIAVNVIKDA